ncbi:MAG: PAS domain S-box protein, partial [Gallionella sp.]|nr:PAS domain S-box protein [Gallionella sp.]
MNTSGNITPVEVSITADGKPNFPPYLRHELLTQVNAIIGYSEMLLEEIADRGGSTKGWQADLDKIRASGADLFQFLENSRTDPGSPEFLANLLYFIRTLVTTIVGYADLLIEEADNQILPETLRDLEIIRNAGHTLVERLHAFVQIDATQASLANLGSAIAEVFPLMRNAVNAMQSRKNKSTRLLPGKLLVVDDDAISRDLLVHELLREGYQVDTAEGGRQALEMIRCGSYDLIILDIVMPEVNGYQVLEQLKNDGTLIDLPVVIISAWIEMDDIAHCIELGAEDYLPRKFNSALLKARVSASLEKKWLREQRQAWLQEKQKVEHAALLASEKKFRQLVSGALVGIFRTTLEGHVLDANPVMLQTLGYESIIELNQAGMQSIYADPGDRQRLLARLSQSPVHGFETRGRKKSGEIFYTAISAQLVSSEDGSEQFLEGTLEDITERKQAEMELRIAATAFESQEGMMVTDASKAIMRVNRSFTRVTGYTAEEAIGQTPRLLNSGRQDAEFYAAMWEHISRAGAWEGEIWNRRKNGEIYPEYLTITAVKDAAGIVTNYVATFNDITVSKAAADEIKNLAFYDPLTHLPNRRLLRDRLKLALASSMRSGREGALLF